MNSRNYYFYIFYILIVFIQVFFIDKFEFKAGVVFLPLLYLIFKEDSKNFLVCSILLLVFYDFFKNSDVGYSLLVFLIANYLIEATSKIWGKGLLSYSKFVALFLIFHFFSSNVLSLNFVWNFLIVVLIIFLREVKKSGYFRFN